MGTVTRFSLRLSLAATTLAGSLAACSPVKAGEDSDPTAAKPRPAPVAASVTPAARPQAREVNEETELYTYYYSYPAQASAMPALKSWLDQDLAKQRAEVARDAAEGKKDAQQNGYPYSAHDMAIAWQVVTDLPGWLSLSASIEAYKGGAHPNHWFGALLWDKRANQRREVAELFTSRQALTQAIRKEFCHQIDVQRKERRGDEYQQGSGGIFEDCIDPLESTVILGSSNRRQFNRIGILVAPYAAGPYVEGSYEVTLPVNAAVLAAVKPEYRQDFAAGR